MTALPFFQVDAFADRPFTGNPAAVMPLGDWLDDTVLQAIAAENNLAETAFLVRDESGAADYELRWFTPTVEIAMCGHATLAAGHVLLGARDRLRFATRQVGVLEVARDGAGYTLDLPTFAPAPQPLPELAAALGVEPEATLWHERGYAVAVLANEAEVRACAPDMRALARLGEWLAIVTAPGTTAEVVSRAFVPAMGIDEDPVTGAAHAVIAPYWAGRLGRERFGAYQASTRGGYIACRLAGDRVELGGRCVTVIEGTMRL